MAQQVINAGAALNDRTGENLRSAIQKLNTMLAEIYALIGVGTVSVIEGVDSLTLQIQSGTATVIVDTNGVTIDGGSDDVTVGTSGNVVILPTGSGDVYVKGFRIHPVDNGDGTAQLEVTPP